MTSFVQRIGMSGKQKKVRGTVMRVTGSCGGRLRHKRNDCMTWQ